MKNLTILFITTFLYALESFSQTTEMKSFQKSDLITEFKHPTCDFSSLQIKKINSGVSDDEINKILLEKNFNQKVKEVTYLEELASLIAVEISIHHKRKKDILSFKIYQYELGLLSSRKTELLFENNLNLNGTNRQPLSKEHLLKLVPKCLFN
jgi:hypothetical protein